MSEGNHYMYTILGCRSHPMSNDIIGLELELIGYVTRIPCQETKRRI